MTETVVVVAQPVDVKRTLFWGIFTAIVAIHFIGWILAALIVLLAAGIAYALFVRHRNQELAAAEARAETLRRADQQRKWFETGDPRAYFGPDWKATDEGSELG